MANNIDGPEITLKASGSLSDYQFHAMTLDTNGRVKLMDDPDDPVEAFAGILQNKPTAIDQEAVLRVSGICKAMGGGSVNPGIWLSVGSNSDGHVNAAQTDDQVIGISIDAVVSGAIGRILLAPGDAYKAPA